MNLPGINNQKKGPVVLISMDGVGVAEPGPGNAVTLANTTTLDKYWPMYPHGMLEASGLYVGLPKGTDGNSEVGHMTMGAGKIILQDLPRIDNAIKNDSFYQNPILNNAFDHAERNKGKLHLMGLVGNGLVHGSVSHLYALLELAVRRKFDPDKLFIHAFADGRDSAPTAGLELFQEVQARCIQKRMGRLASIVGRAYAMDRNRNWERTRIAYDMLTEGKGEIVIDWEKAVKQSYANGKKDEYIDPILIVENSGEQPALVKEGDAVIFFNFRPDRAQQLTRVFEEENFTGWDRKQISNLYFTGFTDYKKGFPKLKAFPPETITRPLGKVLSENGKRQLRISESEKFPHVTYFFNGGNGTVNPGEKWVEIPSPKDVSTYDQKPEMSQEWITDVLLDKISKEPFDFVMVNFAAPDMVAHTGLIEPTIVAMETCDRCVGKIIETTLRLNGAVIITADHGNAEEMLDLQTGQPDTKHSVNQVPIMIISNGLPPIELPLGTLADIAPTVLGLMEIQVPPEMTGRDLLK